MNYFPLPKTQTSLTSARLFLALPVCFLVVLSLSETRMNLDPAWELPENSNVIKKRSANNINMRKVAVVNYVEHYGIPDVKAF